MCLPTELVTVMHQTLERRPNVQPNTERDIEVEN